VAQAPAGELCVLAAGAASPWRGILKRAGARIRRFPKPSAIARRKTAGRSVLLASGHDSRGWSTPCSNCRPGAIRFRSRGRARHPQPVVERPANATVASARLFWQRRGGQAWFYDREFWTGYLTCWPRSGSTAFILTTGLGYDGRSGIVESYFLFRLSVPGFSVPVTASGP